MKKYTIIIFCLICVTFGIKAQDVHFTQQFDNDIYLNPAQSGLGNKANRLVMQYRDQWRSVPVPFASAFISYDRRLFSKDNNLLGGGLQLLYDRAGDGHLSTLKVSLSPSYTRYFADKKIGLSVGIQVGLLQRFVDVDALIFESQMDGNSSGEALSGSVTAPDLGLGVQLSSKIGEKKHKIDGGFSMYNFHQPNLAFAENAIDKRPIRYNAYMKSEFFVGSNGWSINPVFEYQRQEKLDNILPTLYAKKYIKGEKGMAVSFGGGYRVDDAAHMYFAYEINDFKIGVNYDINTSAFNDATNTIGAGEILLKYEFERKKKELVIEELIDSVFEDTTDIVEELTEPEDTVIDKTKTNTVVIQPEKEIVKDKIVVVTPPKPTVLEQIALGENISLFFPNDYPDPRSTSATTKTWYEDIYRQYISMSVEYYRIGGTDGNMVEFIDNYVVKEWDRYNQLIKEVRQLLIAGKTVTFVVRGYTSPLANNDYNLNLSKRRVQSFINQVSLQEDLDQYVKNGKLIIQQQPYGETKANTTVSDDAKNTKKSVYNDKASFERRIEIEKVIVN